MKTLVVLALLCATPALAQKPLPAVYVFTQTDPSGLMDKDTKHRLSVVKDVRKQIGKVARVVESPDDAALTLEIGAVTQGKKESSLTLLANALNPNRPQQNTEEITYTQHATLSMGEYSTDLKADAYSTRSAAMVKQVKDWLKMNADKLSQ